MKIAIWGTGPSGLLAAHAAHPAGHEVSLFSEGHISRLYGAQYLHEMIPGIPNLISADLDHEFRGTLEDYRKKVYNESYVDSVSPGEFTGTRKVYDIRDMYWKLISMYGKYVRRPYTISPGTLMGIDRNDIWSMTRWTNEYDMIINTIPRKALCVDPSHKFNEAKIYALGEAPDMGVTSPIQPERDMLLVCSGESADSWYRLSRIFGHTTVEWPGSRKKPPIKGVVSVYKPISTDCICWPELNHIGRFGRWQKGVLTHHAFEDALQLVTG